jgi:CoA:oxalate CoA-transferase
MSKALQGIRVVDLSHVLAAPTCTMFLADLGAEVIHVEPLHGDDAREFGPFAGSGGKNRSGYFISLNRNKKSLAIDLKQPKGKKILTELIKVSDVVVENFRPNTMRKLGFGWEELQAINPRVIYASISGFGQDTLPGYDTRPSYDMVAQGYSGLMSITGPEGGPPCRVGSSVGDIFAGHQAAIGILAALLYREKTGRGQHFDGAMIDGLFTVLENAVVRYTINSEVPKPLGSAHPTIVPFQSFPTKDDSHIIIALGNDNLWKSFCKLIGRGDLADHTKFATNPLRTQYRKDLEHVLIPEFRKRTRSEWLELLGKANLPHSPVNNVKEICEDPHIAYRKMLVEIDQPQVGKMRIVGSPIRLSETPGEVYAPAPLLGQHSDEILLKILAYTEEEIRILKEEEIINRKV